MATYYPTFSNQRDTLSTNNPGDEEPISYLGSTTYLNQASPMGEFSKILSGTSLSMHNCIQIPIMVGRNERSFMPPSTDALQSVDGELIHNSVAVSHHAIPGSVLDGGRSSQSQGLSLCLSSEIPSDDLQCSYPGNYNDAFGTNALSDMYQFQPGLTGTILNSKYLKVAQELLKEVINVQQALKQPNSDKNASSQPTSSSNELSSEPSEPVNNSSELQNKKTKLLSMLHEVDRRYKQYYHQMKLVVSSFDVVAGCGAAKQYTALALQTISSHFRCLRDAISSQIQLIQRSLGEQDNSSNNQGAAIRRLCYVDHQLRQQRALQQLGVMRNAWRPQRGLPESSVSILRAWLFEHFLHPYPKDSEKIMLAKQTGLTRNQVANWFINARVRLWKPMIEEMYKEEFGEMDSSFRSSLEENYAASEDRGEEFQECMRSKVARVDNVQAQYPKPDHNTDVELNMPASQHGHGTLTAGDAMYALALGLRNHENNIFSMHGETDTRGNHKVASSEGPDTVNFHFTEREHQQNRFGNPHILHDSVV